MVNIIWGVFIIVGIVYSFITGNIEIINDEIINAGKSGFDLVMNTAQVEKLVLRKELEEHW